MRETGLNDTVVADRYRVLSRLGEGAMGSVYLAEDTQLRRQVALKVLRHEWVSRPDVAKRLENECRLMAHLGPHAGIVTLYDRLLFEGDVVLVLEYVPGETLGDVLDRTRAMNAATDATRKTTPVVAGIPAIVITPTDAIEIAMQCLAALDFAHSKGVLHRDIKPGNIMIARDHNGQLVAKLMDFGIGKALGGDDRAPHMTNVTMAGGPGPGTPAYMAPEQIDPARFGQAGPRADLYALGITLFEMLALHLPFGGTYTELLHAHTNLEPPSLREHAPHLSQDLSAVLRKALRKAPGDRYQTAHEFRIDLQAAAFGTGGTILHGAPAPGAYGTPADRAPPRRLALPISLAAVALLTFGGVFAYYALRPAPESAATEPAKPEPQPVPAPPPVPVPPAPPARPAELDAVKQDAVAKETSTRGVLPAEPLQPGEVPEFDTASAKLADAQRAEAEQRWDDALSGYRDAVQAFDAAVPRIEAFKAAKAQSAESAAAAAEKARTDKEEEFKKSSADLAKAPNYAEIQAALEAAKAAQAAGRFREAEAQYARATGLIGTVVPPAPPDPEPKPDPKEQAASAMRTARRDAGLAQKRNPSDPNLEAGNNALDEAERLLANGQYAEAQRAANTARAAYKRVKESKTNSTQSLSQPQPPTPAPPASPPVDAKAKEDAMKAQTRANNAKQDLGIDKKHGSYSKALSVASEGVSLLQKGDYARAKAKFDEATGLYKQATK